MNVKNPPVILVVGTTGSGKSSFCNTLYCGDHPLVDRTEDLPFSTSSSQDRVCTTETKKVETESMFGLPHLFGRCILIDTPGFSEQEDITRARAFLERIMREIYITCVLVVTDSSGRFVNNQNKCVLAILKHIFGETVFDNMIIIVNKWCMDKTSTKRKMLERQTMCDKPEVQMRSQINNVLAALNGKSTNQKVMFTNNHYEPSERYYWEQFEYCFAMNVYTTSELQINKKVMDHCKYYQSNIMKLFNYEAEFNLTPEAAMVSESLAKQEEKIQGLYKEWSTYVSLRLMFVNETDEEFSATYIVTTEGYFENDVKETKRLTRMNLGELRLSPHSAVGIFHRKHWFGTYGVRGKIEYQSSAGLKFIVTWYVSYDPVGENPTLAYDGSVFEQYQIKKMMWNAHSIAPDVRITITKS